MDSFVGAVCALASEPREEARKAANAYLEALQESPDALHVCATALAQPGQLWQHYQSHTGRRCSSSRHWYVGLGCSMQWCAHDVVMHEQILHNVVRNNAKCGALSGDAWSALSQVPCRSSEHTTAVASIYYTVCIGRYCAAVCPSRGNCRIRLEFLVEAPCVVPHRCRCHS
jgi:hypothetical protein